MKSLTLFLFLFSLCLASTVSAQTLNPNWNADLKASMDEFITCSTTPSKDCNRFFGESLEKVYKVNDFYSSKSGKYMNASEAAAFLKTNKQWTLLGHAYEQEVLKNAQANANNKKAVVAVYTNAEGLGHTVVITPGKLQPSGSWGLQVPNAASFFGPQPDKSFIDKSMAYAFAKPMMKDVLIYVRNY